MGLAAALTASAAGSAALFFSAVHFASGATVSSIMAPRGSMMGGTYITVWGSGFSRNGKEGQTLV